MDRSKQPVVHFVGSIPLPDSETVFRDLSGGRASPDAVAGRRDRHPQDWIRFLQDVLAENPAIEPAHGEPPFQFRQWDGTVVREIPRLRVKPGATVDAATFRTGYADMVIDFVGGVRAPAAAGRHPGRREVPGLHSDPDRADLQ